MANIGVGMHRQDVDRGPTARPRSGGGGGMPALPTFPGMGGGAAAQPRRKISFANGKFQVGPADGGGGGTATGAPGVGGGGAGPNLSNYAQKDPRVEKAQDLLEQRYAQQLGQEGQMDPYLAESIQNLRTQQGSDNTNRLTQRALSTIREQGAGLQNQADVRRAQTGQGGGASGSIAQAAQRAGARAASDIGLAQQARQDQLALAGHNILSAPGQMNLARQGQTNALLGTLAGNAGQGAQLGLGQMRLGLDQYGMMGDLDLRRQALAQQQMLGQYDLAGKGLDLYSKYLGLLGSGYGGY